MKGSWQNIYRRRLKVKRFASQSEREKKTSIVSFIKKKKKFIFSKVKRTFHVVDGRFVTIFKYRKDAWNMLSNEAQWLTFRERFFCRFDWGERNKVTNDYNKIYVRR